MGLPKLTGESSGPPVSERAVPSRMVRSRPGTVKPRRSLIPYLFILPAFAIYALFLLWPLIRLIILSLEEWNGLKVERQWVGLANYTRLLSDSRFWSALGHNLAWVGMAAMPIVVGLALAVVLHQARPRGRNVYRVIFFLPYTLTIVLVGVVWKWIYDPVWGPLNAILTGLGLEDLARGWLGDVSTALPALALAANWTGYGFCMMLFLAGLTRIDSVLYDAASIDGADAWQKFRHVTLPGLANTLNLVVLVVFIATVRVFDMVYVTTKGGPINSTDVLGTMIYRETFENLNIGYGAAVATTTALIILAASLVYLRLRERGT
jgi:raffinose/stachyose/melibiose transport system permease protein